MIASGLTCEWVSIDGRQVNSAWFAVPAADDLLPAFRFAIELFPANYPDDTRRSWNGCSLMDTVLIISVMVLSSAATWLACRLLYKMKLARMIEIVQHATATADHGKTIIRKQTILINSYERELGGASPEEAKRRINDLEAIVSNARVKSPGQ